MAQAEGQRKSVSRYLRARAIRAHRQRRSCAVELLLGSCINVCLCVCLCDTEHRAEKRTQHARTQRKLACALQAIQSERDSRPLRAAAPHSGLSIPVHANNASSAKQNKRCILKAVHLASGFFLFYLTTIMKHKIPQVASPVVVVSQSGRFDF